MSFGIFKCFELAISVVISAQSKTDLALKISAVAMSHNPN
jgi:hypothetical protein